MARVNAAVAQGVPLGARGAHLPIHARPEMPVRKPGHGVPPYTRWINRPLGMLVARVAARLGLSPSAVSVIGFLLGVAGLVLLLRGPSVSAGFWAASLLILGYILDSADGQLARMTGASSLRGEWLDHVLDAVRLPLVHLCLAAGVLEASPFIAAVAVAMAVVVSADFFSQNVGGLLRDKGGAAPSAARAAGGLRRTWLNLPKDPGTLYLLLLLWGWPAAFAAGYLVLAPLLTAGALVAATRRWAELKEMDRRA